MRNTAVGFLLLLTVTGCSGSESGERYPSSTQPGTPTSLVQYTTGADHPVPELVLPPESNIMLSSSADLTNTHPVSVTSYSLVEGAGKNIALNFESGSPGCFGVNVSVHETVSDVTVNVKVGTLPSAVGMACTMEVVEATVEVPLDAPLGNRTVRNG
ncbi:hypothetical protein KHP11_27890 [Rhodococcus erythropolis]|jgi:hypothetical protein|uniref:hypothetical protein n=1 Tax=Rhodococcus erythropolis TaxID=1833 RepID=UPI00099526E4|nr:hypothetical protein [Rhodococcus erythropolis]MBT1258288.1 hypothetical protein [Rhodococcus erythropolis]MQP33524.1 hypothetical protein [Rhodococcus erythropolis]